MKSILPICCLSAILLFSPCFSANWFVDNALPSAGAHDGKNWASAWRSPADAAGLGAGDTVYISGGAAGTSQTYGGVVSPGFDHWQPAGGTPGDPIVYKIGQDALHNGTAVFDGAAGNPAGWLGYPNYNNSTNVSNAVISGDAGDGKRHFSVRNYDTAPHGLAVIDFSQNLRISYVDFGKVYGGLNGGNINGFEFDHNYAVVADTTADHFAALALAGTGWDQNRIHDNILYVPTRAGGFGADCFQGCSDGCSIYSNKIVGYLTNYTGGQHQDGWQALGGSYIKMYDNTFIGITNYAVYAEALYGDFTHMWIYNNISVNCGGGIIAGQSGGATASMTFTDVVIANNLVDNADQPYALNNITALPASFVNCVMANNVCVACRGGFGLTGNTTTPSTANVEIAAAAAPPDFVRFSAGDTMNDYHLLAGASALIGAGTNLTQYFSYDKDNNARPAAGAWDIGPYVYKNASVKDVMQRHVEGQIIPRAAIIKKSIFQTYLRDNGGLRVFYLTGRVFDRSVDVHEGVYLVRLPDGKTSRMIEVVR